MAARLKPNQAPTSPARFRERPLGMGGQTQSTRWPRRLYPVDIPTSHGLTLSRKRLCLLHVHRHILATPGGRLALPPYTCLGELGYSKTVPNVPTLRCDLH